MIKSKVGLDHAADVARLQAIGGGHPTCQLPLDANEGYDAPTALRLIRLLRSEGIEPVLFEQPVPREDWEGLGRVAREAGVRRLVLVHARTMFHDPIALDDLVAEAQTVFDGEVIAGEDRLELAVGPD